MLPCCETSPDKLTEACGLQSFSPSGPVHDLTTRIFNTSILAVGFGGFSDVFVGELPLPAMNAGLVPSCKVISMSGIGFLYLLCLPFFPAHWLPSKSYAPSMIWG